METILSEKEKRKTAWAKAVSSSSFEGISPTETMDIIANSFISGDIDIQEAVEQMMQHLSEVNAGQV